MRIRRSRSKFFGFTRFAVATLGLAVAAFLYQPYSAQAAEYWPVLCRGPVQLMSILPNQPTRINIVARAGTAAMHPRPGECVWLDRPMTRPGEQRSDGTATFLIHMRLGLVGVQLNNRNGRISWQLVVGRAPAARRAASIWYRNARGGIFCFGAKRIGPGRYDARLVPTAFPRATSPNRMRVWRRLCAMR